MKLCAYQFPVTGDLSRNMSHIEEAFRQASGRKADLLVFPECALTGYPPVSLRDEALDMAAVQDALERIRFLSDRTGIACLIGTVAGDAGARYNRVMYFSPGAQPDWYDKRILGGWDADRFTEGTRSGIFTLKGVRFAVRICFEVRFPELFREISPDQCDFCIVPFFDVSEKEDPEYRRIIEAHLRTRAAENLLPILSVNATAPCQEAPTAFFDSDGRIPVAADPGQEMLLEWDFTGRDVSASGRRREVWLNRLLKREHRRREAE